MKPLKGLVTVKSKMETIKCTRCHRKNSGMIKWDNLCAIASSCRQKREESKETEPTVEQLKQEIDEVFEHVKQLLVNDQTLENYF